MPQSSSVGLIGLPSLSTTTEATPPTTSFPITSIQSPVSSMKYSAPLPTSPAVTGSDLSALSIAVPVGAAGGAVLLLVMVVVITAMW